MIYRRVVFRGKILLVPEHLVGTLVGILAVSLSDFPREGWGVYLAVEEDRVEVPYKLSLPPDPNDETIQQAGV